MQREFAPARIAASALRLTPRGLVPDQTEQVAARALRHAPAEMRPKRPEHGADVIVRMARDRDAANNDDAAPLLDLVENPGEIGIERRMAAMLGLDLTEPEPLLMETVEQLLESRGVPSGQVECNVVFPEIDAAPGHPLIGQAEGHDILRAGRMLAPFPIPRNCRPTSFGRCVTSVAASRCDAVDDRCRKSQCRPDARGIKGSA